MATYALPPAGGFGGMGMGLQPLPPQVASYVPAFEKYLGPNDKALPISLLRTSQFTTHEKIVRDLWAAWEGINWKSTELFLTDLTQRGGEFLDLFPIMDKVLASKVYGINFLGDTATFDEWRFDQFVLPDASRRAPPRINESIRSSKTQCMTFKSNGFEMDMDFVTHESKLKVFFAYMEQMNGNIKLTWMFRVLETITLESLTASCEKRAEQLPYDHETFMDVWTRELDMALAIQKSGTGMRGLESLMYLRARNRGARMNRVVTTAGSLRHAHIVHEPARVFSEAGPAMYQQLFDTEGKPVAVTSLYHLPIIESRIFDYGGNQDHRDPTVHPMTLSHRFMMLPPDTTSFDNYTSDSRTIEITNGEDGSYDQIKLKDAFLASSIFEGEGAGSQRDPLGITPDHGRKILKALCSRVKSDVERHRQGQGMGLEGKVVDDDADEDDDYGRPGDAPPFFGIHQPTDPQNPSQREAMYDGLKRSVNAYTLFLRAGILTEVVRLFSQMPNEKYQRFVDIQQNQAKLAQNLQAGRGPNVIYPGGSFRPRRQVGSGRAGGAASMSLSDIRSRGTGGNALPQPGAPSSSSVAPLPPRQPRFSGSGPSGHSPSAYGDPNAEPYVARPTPETTSSGRHVAQGNVVWLQPRLHTQLAPFTMNPVGINPYRMLEVGGLPPIGSTDGYGILLTAVQEIRAAVAGQTAITAAEVRAINSRLERLKRSQTRTYADLFEEGMRKPHELPILVANATLATLAAVVAERQAAGADRGARAHLNDLKEELKLFGALFAAPASGPEDQLVLLQKQLQFLAGGGQGPDNKNVADLRKLVVDVLDHLAEEKKAIEEGKFTSGQPPASNFQTLRDRLDDLRKRLLQANEAKDVDAGGATTYADHPLIGLFLGVADNALPTKHTDVKDDDLAWVNRLCGEGIRMNNATKRELSPLDGLIVHKFVNKFISRIGVSADAQDTIDAARQIGDAKSAIQYILRNRDSFVDEDERRKMVAYADRQAEHSSRRRGTRRARSRRRSTKSDDETDSDSEDEDDGGRRSRRRGPASNRVLQLQQLSVEYRSPQLVKRMLYDMRISDIKFWDALISENVPFPMTFMLLQMHIRLMVGCMIMLKADDETGVMAINEAAIMYARNPDTFTIRVYARFSCGTFILNSRNLEFQGHTFAVAYRGGAGTSLYDYTMDHHEYHNGRYPKDIFVLALPYWYRPQTFLTEITGTMHPEIYSNTRSDYWRLPTGHIYAEMWRWARHRRAYRHPFSREFYKEGDPRSCTIAVESSKKVWAQSPNGGSGSISNWKPGKSVLGEYVTPYDYGVVRNTNEFLGGGMEGSASRLQYRHPRETPIG